MPISTVGTADGPRFDAGQKALGLAFMRERARRMLDGLVAFWVFCGGLVIVQPSPYEFAFVLVLPVALFAGIGLYRSSLGILALLVGFLPFALIAAFQVTFSSISDSLIFTIITAFLFTTAYFLANYVAEETIVRVRLIINAYTAIAVITALIGAGAYLGVIPGGEDLFLRYGRAKALFEDPNVYGPFLILPAAFALQRILLARGRRSFWAAVVYLILFVGVFASFSRAAWGHLAFTSVMVLVLVFWLEALAHDKVRIMILSLVGIAGLAIAMGGLLSIPAVGKLFETRAASQEYDSGETGRFGRQGYAFDLALDHPWGIGPGEFHNMRIIEEPHDTYVSTIHVYGWGGGAMYYMFAALTLWKGFSSLTRPSPFRPLMIPLISTFAMLAGEAAIIDIDHWRHYYLLAGLIWGVSAAIRNSKRTSLYRNAAVI
ncbi:O-antigen ligase family protein [Devosia sp.]|uniref:O-antigen ligase family protein n=1 Tax=Devosia sp. TaxID=1871048 RepID=UPI00326376ED